MRRSRIMLCAAALLLLFAVTVAAKDHDKTTTKNSSLYNFVSIRVPNATYTWVNGINSAGDIVGYFQVSLSDYRKHGFLLRNGQFTTIDVPGASETWAFGINKNGWIVGQYSDDSTFQSRGFLLVNGTFTTMDKAALGISDNGDIVSSGPSVLHNGSWTDIDVSGCGWTGGSALGINNYEVIVGGQGTPYFSPFRFENGTCTEFPMVEIPPRPNPAYFEMTYRAVNNYNEIVGATFNAIEDYPYAMYFTDRGMIDIGLPAAGANGINDAGIVVGSYHSPAVPYDYKSVGFAAVPIYRALVQPPINADGHSVFSARREVVPVKFSLLRNGRQTCDLPAATIALTRTGDSTLTPIDESVYSTRSNRGSDFRTGHCEYTYNLAASSLGAGIYRVDIKIGIMVGHAAFTLR